MSTIVCTSCVVEIETWAALQGETQARMIATEHKKHMLERVKKDALAKQRV